MRQEGLLKLYSYLTEHHKDEVLLTLESLQMGIEELELASGSPSNLPVHDFHSEQRRLAKIQQLVYQILPTLPSSRTLANLMRGAGVAQTAPQKHRPVSSSSSLFVTPFDIFRTSFEKEKVKYDHSLEVIDRIDAIKHKKEVEGRKKLLKYEEKQKKIKEEQLKKEEALEAAAVSHKRNMELHAKAKKEIEKNIERQMKEYGERLEKRMTQLDNIQKEKYRKQLKKEVKNIKDWIKQGFKKAKVNKMSIRAEEEKSAALLQDLIDKQEISITNHENKVILKTQNAKVHSDKVKYLLKNSKIREQKQVNANIARCVQKSHAQIVKQDKKTERHKETAEEAKVKINKSFSRHSKGLKSVNIIDVNKVRATESRVSRVDRGRERAQSLICTVKKKKAQEQSARVTQHSHGVYRTVAEKEAFKEKVMEKHRRMSLIVEAINQQRSELSNKKRQDNLDIQRARNLKLH